MWIKHNNKVEKNDILAMVMSLPLIKANQFNRATKYIKKKCKDNANQTKFITDVIETFGKIKEKVSVYNCDECRTNTVTKCGELQIAILKKSKSAQNVIGNTIKPE